MSENAKPKQRILMCAPDFFEVIYEINPWMDKKVQPLADVAETQWRGLTDNLKKAGAALEFIAPVKGLPDLVYTANGGLIKGSSAILSRFKVKERQGEEIHFHKWFEQHGFSVQLVQKGAFEGEGDALFAGDTLVYGTGFRSEASAADEVAKYVNAKDLIVCELVDPYFYHVDTCICPISKNLAFFNSTAFSKNTIKDLEKHFELYAVPDAEAKKFVCNAVVVDKTIVLPSECPATYAWLKTKGYETLPTPLDQFLRGGGSAKCLTLFLDRA